MLKGFNLPIIANKSNIWHDRWAYPNHLHEFLGHSPCPGSAAGASYVQCYLCRLGTIASRAEEHSFTCPFNQFPFSVIVLFVLIPGMINLLFDRAVGSIWASRYETSRNLASLQKCARRLASGIPFVAISSVDRDFCNLVILSLSSFILGLSGP